MPYNFKLFLQKVFPLIFLITNCYLLKSQNYPSDCVDAYRICQLGDYHFSSMHGHGSQEHLSLPNSGIRETNSLWLQFEVENGGEMEFVIVPENQEDDIDFVLYESDDCSNLTPIRIMTSGEMMGADYSETCLGQTGLRYTSNDTHESSGCFQFDDNFLKPVRLNNQKRYYLFINNFNSGNGFNILFSGEEGLKLIDHCGEKSSLIDFEIYPNPVISEITIKTEKAISNPVEVVMFDMSGKILLTRVFDDMMQKRNLDVSSYPSGEYYLRIVSEEHIGLKSLIKI